MELVWGHRRLDVACRHGRNILNQHNLEDTSYKLSLEDCYSEIHFPHQVGRVARIVCELWIHTFVDTFNAVYRCFWKTKTEVQLPIFPTQQALGGWNRYLVIASCRSQNKIFQEKDGKVKVFIISFLSTSPWLFHLTSTFCYCLLLED